MLAALNVKARSMTWKSQNIDPAAMSYRGEFRAWSRYLFEDGRLAEMPRSSQEGPRAKR